jgi:hypothetical protein
MRAHQRIEVLLALIVFASYICANSRQNLVAKQRSAAPPPLAFQARCGIFSDVGASFLGSLGTSHFSGVI